MPKCYSSMAMSLGAGLRWVRPVVALSLFHGGVSMKLPMLAEHILLICRLEFPQHRQLLPPAPGSSSSALSQADLKGHFFTGLSFPD